MPDAEEEEEDAMTEEDEDAGTGAPVEPLSLEEIKVQFATLCPYRLGPGGTASERSNPACVVEPLQLCDICTKVVARRMLGELAGPSAKAIRRRDRQRQTRKRPRGP